MIKGQDIVLLVKLITNKESRGWSQLKLSQHLCMSSSIVNSSLRRLWKVDLISSDYYFNGGKLHPIQTSCEEFIISCSFLFPPTIREETAGLLTQTSSPVFKAANLIPGYNYVWPDAEGSARGLEFSPLYPTIAKALRLHPDEPFYEMLCLIDGLRYGMSRTREYARTHLTKRIKECL